MSKRFQVNPLGLLDQNETSATAVRLSRKLAHIKVNPFDLLGQNEPFPIAFYLPGTPVPNFTIAWKSFHQSFEALKIAGNAISPFERVVFSLALAGASESTDK